MPLGGFHFMVERQSYQVRYNIILDDIIILDPAYHAPNCYEF